MIGIDTAPVVKPRINIELNFQDLADKIQTSQPRPSIIAAAESVFETIQDQWQPAMVYQWTTYTRTDENTGILALPSGLETRIHPGHSSQFLSHARYALAAVYTAGSRLDELAAAASREQDFMAAHFIDLTGLLVLEKVEAIVKQTVEQAAREHIWGVGPFLSPGSVHGWELEEQEKLARLLPIDQINVSLSGAGVFSPFKTISCLIGTGPGYESRSVGTTCRVCSRKENCTMRHNRATSHSPGN